jgi:hypothetical protein
MAALSFHPMKSLAALLLVVAGPLAAQGGWRLVPTTDDFTGASDRRLVLRADSTTTLPGDTATLPRDARDALVVACGDRLPGAGRRSLLIHTTVPWELYGAASGYAELRFDRPPQTLRTYPTLLDYGAITPTGHVVARHVAFLGTDDSPYFSARLISRLLDARTLSITYRVVGGERTLSFHVEGLREALRQLSGCDWTK